MFFAFFTKALDWTVFWTIGIQTTSLHRICVRSIVYYSPTFVCISLHGLIPHFLA